VALMAGLAGVSASGRIGRRHENVLSTGFLVMALEFAYIGTLFALELHC
jgi:hypothetical protein